MCGRCCCTLGPDDIPRACYLDGRSVHHQDTDRYRQSYNVSPGWNLLVVRRDGGSDDQGVVIHCMKWGLVPSFTKKTEKPDHYRMFNARSESVTEKASFRRLVPHNRCLVPVDGFFEWKKDGSKKQPYYVHFRDGRPLVFAALYDSWKNSEGDILYTFTILTTSSSSALAWLHDRMPVILGDKASTDVWLNEPSTSKLDMLLKPNEEPDLVWYPVTPAMGKISFDGPECIKEIQPKTEEIKPISKFFAKKESSTQQELKKESAEADETKNLKVKCDLNHDFLFTKSDDRQNSDASTATCEGLPSFQTKREYEDFSHKTKPSLNDVKRIGSPAKKKGKVETAGDEQPTLFSYFGKR